MRESRSRERGLSVIEFGIALTTLIVLASSAAFLYSVFSADSIYRKIDMDLTRLNEALEEYQRNNLRKPPTAEQGLGALISRPAAGPEPERWRAQMSELRLDPWGNDYQYRSPAVRSNAKYDLFSMGEDGIESGDDIGNW